MSMTTARMERAVMTLSAVSSIKIEEELPQRLLGFSFARNSREHTIGYMMSRLWKLPRRTLIALIKLYQYTLSPDHGLLKHLHPYGFCRHHPTCSEYGKLMIRNRGAVVGSF